jgi:hypothetical protein
MSQIKKKLKKFGKIGVLLGIKESYLLSRNVLGLGVHPFKTLRAMQREKDRSQQLLVLGLPVYVLVMGTAMVWLGRRWLGTTVEWGWLAKVTALGVMGITGLVGGYVLYWWIRTWRAKI